MVKIDKGTRNGIYFSLGTLLSVISVLNFNQYQIPAFVGILLGIFFIVKSLS